jgi:hypothetical protein
MGRACAAPSSWGPSKSKRDWNREEPLMPTKTVEQCAIELDGRLRSRTLESLGPVTIGHGTSVDFEEAVRTTLAELDQLNRRHQRGAWVDHEHEGVIRSDVEHLYWLAEFRDRRR